MAGLSINEVTTFRWPFDEDVARYRDAGIEAIGIWRQKLADYGEDRGIELIKRSGLAVSNLLWAGGFTGSDGHSYQESVEDAAAALRLAGALGTRHLVVYSGARNGHTTNHAHRLFLCALRDLLPLAEQLGVSLAIEPMHPSCAGEWTLVTCLDGAISVMDHVGSPYVQLAFDTYHLGYDPTIVERVVPLISRIGIVHLGDSGQPPERQQNRRPLGEGVLPLPGIVRALRQAGYEGYFDVELIGEAIESCDYVQLLKQSKETFDSWTRC